MKLGFNYICVQLSESRALFKRPISIFFNKIFIKIGFHGIIHTFKNYFATVFSVFSNKQYPNRPLVSSGFHELKVRQLERPKLDRASSKFDVEHVELTDTVGETEDDDYEAVVLDFRLSLV